MWAGKFWKPTYFLDKYWKGAGGAEAFDTHDGVSGDRRLRPTFPTTFEDSRVSDDLTNRDRAVVQAVLEEATHNEELASIPAIAEAIRTPRDPAIQAELARRVALGEFARHLSFEFELLVQQFEEQEDIAALIAMRMI